MGLQSMTGFGRGAVDGDGVSVSWELKSVNGKSLEPRLRTPAGFERIEQPVRQAIQRRFSRGNLQAVLSVSREAGQGRLIVNDAFLSELVAQAKRLEKEYGVAPACADGLLALRGVIEMPDGLIDDQAREATDAAVLEALERALDNLEQSRRSEGQALGALLAGHLDTIAELTARAEADPSRQLSAIRERLAEHVRLLLDTGQPLDEARLAMEAAFLATKADIREEIDRLKTHVASGHALLAQGGVIGRKLDFLAQEFNRESNTLCSKSNAASITAIGLELKAVVDQFREQVQNLE